MAVKTSAQLTRERKEFNGLDSIYSELIEQRHGTRYAVVAFEVLRVSDEVREGVEVPTVQFTHIEPVRGDLEAKVREILAERYQDRTGKSLDGDPALLDPFGQVPEAGAEELLAERAEAKAAQDGGQP